MKRLLTGNEAIAAGAYEAGVRFASAYPGTPSTEILENLSQHKDIVAEWAPNEKVAFESAAGASMAGARAIVSMKHVGVNVAADPLFTYAYMGVGGGFLLVSADEPGQHSSQNEQDNRYYAKMAKIPMLEPSNSQECLDMVKTAFELSEAYDTPVMLRTTTRVCHSKSIVEDGQRTEVPIKEYVKDISRRITVPDVARKMRLRVEERMNRLKEYSETTSLNFVEDHGSSTGVIVSGMCYHYAREYFGDRVSYLKLGFTNPLPMGRIQDFVRGKEKVYIIEEDDPYLEDAVRSLGVDCLGKNTFPFCGEMTPDVIAKAVSGQENPTVPYDPNVLPKRPPAFCAGCPHRGLFYVLGKRKDVVVSGDIGCYTLGFSDPYNAMDWNICMGSSISCAHGAQKVFDMVPGNQKKVVGVIGDSTFFHTGVNSLLDVAYNQSNCVNIILDNRITGMTGHQQNPGTGYTAQMQPTPVIDLEAVVRACGIHQIRVIDPNNLKEVSDALDWAVALKEPSVIITRWPCVLKRLSQADLEEFGSDVFKEKCKVDTAKCIGCKKCVTTGCPALSIDTKAKKAVIDAASCVGCGVCAQVCPVGAIAK